MVVGWSHPLVKENVRQRVGSSPAVEIRDFVGSCWVQCMCNLVLAQSAVVSPAVWTFVTYIIL